MQSVFSNAERVLASVAALSVFALNEVRMFRGLPRTPDPSSGQTHAVWLRIADGQEQVYLSFWDLALRWGLAGITAALALWALAETFQPRATTAR